MNPILCGWHFSASREREIWSHINFKVFDVRRECQRVVKKKSFRKMIVYAVKCKHHNSLGEVSGDKSQFYRNAFATLWSGAYRPKIVFAWKMQIARRCFFFRSSVVNMLRFNYQSYIYRRTRIYSIVIFHAPMRWQRNILLFLYSVHSFAFYRLNDFFSFHEVYEYEYDGARIRRKPVVVSTDEGGWAREREQ